MVLTKAALSLVLLVAALTCLSSRAADESKFVQTVVKGKLHDVYYWCENCALAYIVPGRCLCCDGTVKRVELEVTATSNKPSPLLVPR